MSNTAVALDLMILDIQNSNCLVYVASLKEAPVYTGLKLPAIITFGVVDIHEPISGCLIFH